MRIVILISALFITLFIFILAASRYFISIDIDIKIAFLHSKNESVFARKSVMSQ